MKKGLLREFTKLNQFLAQEEKIKEVGQKPWSILPYVITKFQHDGILVSDESPYQRIAYIFVYYNHKIYPYI